MQKVSKEYKASMKDSLRERAYIMISFGVVNQEAQAKAKVDSGEFAYFSNPDNLFNEETDDVVYATLEENFTRVDGSMYFLPRNKPGAMFYNTGLVGKNLVSDGLYEVTINLHAAPTDFRGITINFGENYPTDFDFVTNTGQKVEFRDNDKAVFTTEEVLENVTTLTLVIHKMKNLRSRLRIYSFRFGYGLVYYNDSVMSSSLESYVSPIGADIPQIDFSVTLKNYDKYFNVDNPKSAINFLETGQEMDIYYGYQLPNSDEIEWVRGNHLLCSEWESDDYTATIRCQDVFRNMDTEYYKGLYAPNGKSYYDLAIEVLEAAGEKDYYVDPRLKKLYTKNPIPRVSCKEALQIIANACRCVLSQSRVGTIQIKSSFVPEAAASSNGETDYSHVAKILTDDTKDEYATLASNYTTADGTMFFLPRAASKRTLNTGFISEQQSDADITVKSGDVETFYVGEPSYNFRATLDESSSGVSITAWGNYYVTVKFSKTGTFRLEILGYRYKIVERYATKSLNSRGKSVKWANPLISDMAIATELAEWIGDYYTAGIEYEYDTRGNPEIDANDIVYQENEFHDGMKVNIYRHTINFDQAFSGKVTARRVSS